MNPLDYTKIWICLVCDAPQSPEAVKAWKKGRITTCNECKEMSKLFGDIQPTSTLYVWNDQ